jgi:hypothetical protein
MTYLTHAGGPWSARTGRTDGCGALALGTGGVVSMADWRTATAFAALAMVAFAPGEAAAQTTFREHSQNEAVADRPHSEYEALGVPFGSFIIRPALEAGAETTDNFFANDFNVGAQDDVTYTLRGSAEVTSQWSRHELKLAFGAQHATHDKFTKDDATTGNASGELRIDVTRDTEIGGGGSVENMIEERTAPDAPTSAVKPVQYTYSESYLYGGHTFNRVRVSARYAHRDYNYDDAYTQTGVVIDEDIRDHVEDIGTARVEYLVSPRMALLLEGVWNNRDYDAFGRGSNGYNYTAGASVELAQLIDGEVRVGYLSQEHDSPAVGTIDGAAVNADINWYPTQLTTVSFKADREVEDSGNANNASYLLTRAGLTVDHELFRNVVLSFGLAGGKRDYNGIDRKDDYTTLDLSGAYLVNRNVSVRAGYAHEQVNSDGAARNRDFDVNRAFISLALRV